MLLLENVTKTFIGPTKRIEVLRNLSFEIKANDFISIRGESGCGKSTLMLLASGLMRPDSGTVALNGKDLYGFSDKDLTSIRSAEIGFVFQELLLLPYLTVRENILAASIPDKTSKPNRDAETETDRLLDRFAMSKRSGHYPSKLSTGEKQRVAFARALLNGPKVLFADEPTGNLDPDNAVKICGYFDEFVKDGGTVVLVTHDKNVAARATKRFALSDGKLINVKDNGIFPSS